MNCSCNSRLMVTHSVLIYITKLHSPKGACNFENFQNITRAYKSRIIRIHTIFDPMDQHRYQFVTQSTLYFILL